MHFGHSIKTILDILELHQGHIPLGAISKHFHSLDHSELLEEVLQIVSLAGLATQRGDMEGIAWRIYCDGLLG